MIQAAAKPVNRGERGVDMGEAGLIGSGQSGGERGEVQWGAGGRSGLGVVWGWRGSMQIFNVANGSPALRP